MSRSCRVTKTESSLNVVQSKSMISAAKQTCWWSPKPDLDWAAWEPPTCTSHKIMFSSMTCFPASLSSQCLTEESKVSQAELPEGGLQVRLRGAYPSTSSLPVLFPVLHGCESKAGEQAVHPGALTCVDLLLSSPFTWTGPPRSNRFWTHLRCRGCTTSPDPFSHAMAGTGGRWNRWFRGSQRSKRWSKGPIHLMAHGVISSSI